MTNTFTENARVNDGVERAPHGDSTGLINAISFSDQLSHHRNEHAQGTTELPGLSLASFDGKSINFEPASDARKPQIKDQHSAIVEVDKPFDLGVPSDKVPHLGRTFQSDPELADGVFALSGEPAGEPTVYGGSAADSARVKGMQQMMGKYGVERFKETLDKLGEIGGKPEFYAYELRIGPGEGGAQLNAKLRQLSNLMEPGRVEQAVEVAKLLRNDGFEKKLSLQQMNDPKLMELLKANPAERKALIEFEHSTKKSLAALKFVRENPDALKMKPTETLDAFKRWSAKRK